MDSDAREPHSAKPRIQEHELRGLITAHVADVTGLTSAEVEADRPLAEYGLSSRDAVALAGYLQTLLDQPLSPTIVWEHPTIADLARLVAIDSAAPKQATVATAAGSEEHARAADERDPGGSDPVAVIGMGCRFPGGAAGPITHPAQFWRFLRAGGNAVGEVPAQRWAWFWERAAVDEAALPEVTRWAGILDEVAGFDAGFFGISPAEATTMDPQQRLLLEVAWEALEQAGLPPRGLAGSKTGVFAGISTSEYAHLTAADPGLIDAWTATGAASSVAAGRIAYLLDFRGPSMAVDTACSSSLVAVHLAAASLRERECDLALAGGVNLLLSPAITMAFDAGGGTSPDGRCRPFDAAANGMVRGEGCGVVVLKRLADARRDGDRVLAVLAGSAVGSDGRSNGLVAPNGEAQRDLLRNAYATAGVDPSTVGYVEAHGTGTPLGDPIEAHALGDVLGQGRPADRPLLIGSVKSNIGHLEAAAGVAGIIKAVLALAHRQIPPSANFAQPSPHIAFDELGLAVPVAPTPWPPSDGPARAGVSAFGFSGMNAHIVLEAPAEPAVQGATAARPGGSPRPRWRPDQPAAFLLSDVSPARIREQARQLARWLDEPGGGTAPNTADVAATLARRGGRGPHRCVVVARDRDELTAGLAAVSAGEPHPGVVAGTELAPGPGLVAVFSGYGSQWPEMGRRLAAAEPVFAGAINDLEDDIRAAAGVSLRAAVFGDGAGASDGSGTSEGASAGAGAGDGDEDGSGQRALTPDLSRVEHAQPVLFGIQVALARLWAAYGIVPTAVIGHSMGEVAAAVVSGALTAADGARVIALRSRLLSRIAGSGGGMAIVGLSAAAVTEFARDLPDVQVAVMSSPVQSVVAGDLAQVTELARRVAERGVPSRVLEAEGAGHSPQVDPLLPELLAELADLTPWPSGADDGARPRFYSTVSDDARQRPGCDAAYWAANMRQPVRLEHAVAAAVADGFRAFVEVSPHPVVGRALTETLRHHGGADSQGGADSVVTGTLRRGDDDVVAFHRQLAGLIAAGIAVRDPAAGAVIDLPPVPWQHDRYWPARPHPAQAANHHPLLGPHTELPSGRGHAWSATPGRDALARLRTVWHGRPVFPLSAAAEMALAAAGEAWEVPAGEIVLTDVRLERMVPVSSGLALATQLEETAPLRATVQIFSKNDSGDWVLAACAAARVREEPANAADAPDARQLPPAPAGGPAGPRPARDHRVPARLAEIDACLAKACGQPDDMPTAIGTLRIGAAPVASGVTVTRVQASQVPVAHRDKLLRRSWIRQQAPAADGARPSPVARPAGGRWLLLTAPGGEQQTSGQATFAAELAAALASAGQAAGPPVSLAEDAITAFLAEHCLADHGADPAGGVVVIAPEAPLSVADAERFIAAAVRVAATLARWPGTPPRLWFVTAGAVTARPGEAGEPGLAAIEGLVRVLALERPALRATLADTDPTGDPAGAAAAVAAELVADAPDDEIAWRDGQRLVARLDRAAEGPAGGGRRARRPVVRPGGSYIVTGGHGGSRHGSPRHGSPGLVAAQWLAERGAGRLVLAGQFGAASRAVVHELRRRGTEVRVLRADAATPLGAARLVAAAREGGASLRGVVHAAGLFAHSPVTEVTANALARAWAPKAGGASTLHDAIEEAGAEPDWMVLFSSAAALLGAPGRVADATANAWLDGFAAWRSAQGRPTFAVGWSAWAPAGRAGEVAIPGVDPLTPDEGIADLEALLAGEQPVTAVARADLARVAAAFPAVSASPFFERLLLSGGAADHEEGAEPGRAGQAGAAERVRSTVAAVLGLPAAGIPGQLTLADAGLDSLAAQRIASLLKQELGVTIEPAAILGPGATLAALQGLVTGQEPMAAQDLVAGQDQMAPEDLVAGEGLVAAAAPAADAAGEPLPEPALPHRRVEARDAAERQVLRVITDVLGAPGLGVTQNLRLFGLTDSARREIAARLAAETGRPVDPDELLRVPTVEAAAEKIRGDANGNGTGAAGLISLLRPTALRSAALPSAAGAGPVLLIHPAGGNTDVYKILAGLLDADRPVLGLERQTGSVTERARHYCAEIIDRFPGVPCVLGGWSFGGVLGYETARCLAAAGQRPELVILLDAALPLPLPGGTEESALAWRFAAFAEYLTRTYGRPVTLREEELAGLEEDEQLALLTDRMAMSGLTAELSPAILRHQLTSHVDTRALERYAAGPYDGRVVLYRAEQEAPWTVRDPRYAITDPALGWGPLCSRLEVVPVDAHHLNLLDPPAVRVVAEHLRSRLAVTPPTPREMSHE